MIPNVIKKLCALSLIVFAAHAEAQVVLQQLTVPLSVEFDTNPTFSDTNKQSIWRYTAIPTYTISAVEDNNRWYSNIGFRIQRSSNKNVSIDREDPNLVIGWDRQGERDELKLVANYNENSTRNTELTTTGLINSDVTATTKSIAADWSRLLTERLNFSLGGELLKTSYDSAGFTGYTTKSINSALSYQATEKLITFVNIGYVRYNSDSQNNLGLQASRNSQNSQNYLGGITYVVNPQLDFTVAAGRNHITSSGYANIARASFNYQAERHLMRGELERSVSATGIGNFQESDRLNLNYSYDLSDKSAIGTGFSLQKNNSLNSNEITYLNGFYSRDLSDRWAMRVSLDYRKIKDTSRSVSGEIAGLTFIYTTPEF